MFGNKKLKEENAELRKMLKEQQQNVHRLNTRITALEQENRELKGRVDSYDGVLVAVREARDKQTVALLKAKHCITDIKELMALVSPKLNNAAVQGIRKRLEEYYEDLEK